MMHNPCYYLGKKLTYILQEKMWKMIYMGYYPFLRNIILLLAQTPESKKIFIINY